MDQIQSNLLNLHIKEVRLSLHIIYQ